MWLGAAIHATSAALLRRRLARLQQGFNNPDATQNQVVSYLFAQGAATHFGRDHGFERHLNLHQFAERVPVRTYEELYPYLERTLRGEAHVLWPGRPRWFAKSSGTTNDRSKYIPLTPESFAQTHYRAGRDTIAWYFANHGRSHGLSGRALSIGGSSEVNQFADTGSRYGDLSACLIENLPPFYQWLRTPSRRVALMAEWEAKLEAMAHETYGQDIVSIFGVPTWTVVLIRRLLALYQARTGRAAPSLRTLWPRLEVFFHGAVSFTPYRAQFAQLIPEPDMRYWEVYNASEGYFACQYAPGAPGMALLPGHGIYYEFVALEDLGSPHPPTRTLAELALGQVVAPVISTVGGLWRYLIGDTVEVVGLNPVRVVVAGRTQHYINAFGEELMVANTDAALAEACAATGAVVVDYTAAPIYFTGQSSGAHEWAIEFSAPPPDLAAFVVHLDAVLQRLNSDYAAKRYADLALRLPVVHAVAPGTFAAWLKARGKLGGQHKVPRLKNDRTVLEAVLGAG